MKSLIIDLSNSGEIKILVAKITSTVSILSGYYLTFSPSDDPMEVIKTKLADERLSELPAFIIPPDEMVRKQNFALPKMPDKEIKKVLPREIAAASDSTTPMIYNYLKNGFVEERQQEKMEVTAFFCPKDQMFEFINRLTLSGIRAKGLIPSVQGLKTLTELNTAFSNERTGTVFLELMDNRINLNIFKEKYWGLDRDFLYRMERSQKEDDLTDEDFTRIATELNRTFQYFKQRNRGYSIDHVAIYGAGGSPDNLKNLINDNQPVTAATVQQEHFGSKVTFPSHLKDSREFLSIFTLSIATAIAVSNKKYLDIFPPEYVEKSKLFSRLIGIAISTAIIAVILGGSIFYFENIKHSYKQDISSLQKSFTTLSQNAASIMKTKQQRANFFKRRYYLDFPIQYAYSAANFVRKLSLAATQYIQLMEIETDPLSQTFTFKLNGRINADDNITAQSRFLEFYQKLKEFDDILQINSSNVTVNPWEANSRLASPSGTPAANETKEMILYFTIDGEVEPE